MKKSFRMLSLGLLLAAAGVPALIAGEPVPYPEGYRNWTHVKSMVIRPTHPLADPFGGIHHVYANVKALKGLRSGVYEKGAMFVFDLLEAREERDAVVEGARKLIGVMLYDPGRFRKTGGWGFEGFAGNARDRRLVSDGGAACFACHERARDTRYVFSAWRP